MDLIYADEYKDDVGVLQDYKFDLAYGSGENDFEITVSTSNHVCREDYLVYIEGTEYGGMVDAVEVDTKGKTVKYKGRTFHGMLDKKVICPDSGQDYYVVSGDANTIIGNLITRYSLTGLFVAVRDKSVTLNSYKFSRYTTLYAGICKMLSSVGYKLHMVYNDGKVILSAVPIVSYSDDDGLDSDRINFLIQKTYNPVNHLICLGAGELKNRTVIHLYLDANGNVGTSQYFTGLQEVTETYDYPSVESAEELRQKGTQQLKSQDTNMIDMSLGEGYSFDIGDVISTVEVVTGIEVKRTIRKKIVTINKDILKINYKVGE